MLRFCKNGIKDEWGRHRTLTYFQCWSLGKLTRRLLPVQKNSRSLFYPVISGVIIKIPICFFRWIFVKSISVFWQRHLQVNKLLNTTQRWPRGAFFFLTVFQSGADHLVVLLIWCSCPNIFIHWLGGRILVLLSCWREIIQQVIISHKLSLIVCCIICYGGRPLLHKSSWLASIGLEANTKERTGALSQMFGFLFYLKKWSELSRTILQDGVLLEATHLGEESVEPMENVDKIIDWMQRLMETTSPGGFLTEETFKRSLLVAEK